MSNRTVELDFTEQEARTIAALLDIGASIAEGLTDAPPSKDIEELRARFLAGIAISQAEQILRGRA